MANMQYGTSKVLFTLKENFLYIEFKPSIWTCNFRRCMLKFEKLPFEANTIKDCQLVHKVSCNKATLLYSLNWDLELAMQPWTLSETLSMTMLVSSSSQALYH